MDKLIALLGDFLIAFFVEPFREKDVLTITFMFISLIGAIATILIYYKDKHSQKRP